MEKTTSVGEARCERKHMQKIDIVFMVFHKVLLVSLRDLQKELIVDRFFSFRVE